MTGATGTEGKGPFACTLKVSVPATDWTAKWFNDATSTYSLDSAPAYNEAGVYTNVVQVKKTGYYDFYGTGVVTVVAQGEPSTMGGRTISNAMVSGVMLTFDLGAAANDISLWVAGGADDRGEDFDAWANAGEAKFVKFVKRGDAISEQVNLVDCGLLDAKVVRLFTRPAYDATLTGLVGAGSAQKVGPYIDTGVTPVLDTDKVEVEFARSAASVSYGQAVVTARKVYNSGNRMCVILNNSNNTLRFDYSNGSGTGQFTSSAISSGTRYLATVDGTADKASLSVENKSSGEVQSKGGFTKIGTAAANASWGYVVSGLGGNRDEVACVFTNTTAAMDWTIPSDVTKIDYLVVGGGGGGGYSTGGGGGGGANTVIAGAKGGDGVVVLRYVNKPPVKKGLILTSIRRSNGKAEGVARPCRTRTL